MFLYKSVNSVVLSRTVASYDMDIASHYIAKNHLVIFSICNVKFLVSSAIEALKAVDLVPECLSGDGVVWCIAVK